MTARTSLWLAACLAACADGLPGREGPPGPGALLRIDPEPAGASCATGGSKISAGTDDDRDGVLDDDEVDSTAYVCNGPAGPPGTGDGATRIRVDPAAAAFSCPGGGWLVLAGVDDDGDGALDDDEIDDAAYVCQAGGVFPGPVLEGSFTIANQIDVALLNGVTEITGDVTVSGTGLATIRLPTVHRIGGAFTVAEGAGVQAIDLAALEEIDAIDSSAYANPLTTLRAPVLTRARRIVFAPQVSGSVTLDLSSLPSCESLRIDAALADVEGLRALTTAGELSIHGAGTLRSLAGLRHLATAGTLTLAGLDLDAPGALPALTHTDVLHIGGGFGTNRRAGPLSFPALATADEVVVDTATGADTIVFDALRSTERFVVSSSRGLATVRAPALTGSPTTDVAVSDSPDLHAFDLGALAAARTVQTSQSGLADLSGLAALRTITGDLLVFGNDSMSHLALPALERVAGTISITDHPMLASLSLPALAMLGTHLTVRNAPLLCRSQVDAIATHLQGLGWMGTLVAENLREGC